jgi:16S rRNA G527 N7-methylase RsmG
VETLRLEELLHRPSMRESADVVTMRAVRADKSTLRAIESLLKPEGAFLLFRTSSKERRTPAEEADASGLLYRSSQPLLSSLRSELAIYAKKARRR